MKRTLVLGAGFGGITVATELRRLLGSHQEVVLVDRRDSFVMGLRKLWALAGLGTLDEGRRSRAALEGPGIRFVQQDVRAIDPAGRSATTDAGTLTGDYMVVALGAEPRADLVPGLVECGHNLYADAAIAPLAAELDAFSGGRIGIVIAGVPYRCPPAPFECAMLLDARLRSRGLRDDTTLTLTTLQPMLLPNAGREGSDWLGQQLRERNIEFHVGRTVERVEPGRVIYQGGDELAVDLLIGVPPHRPPAVMAGSGLLNDAGWVSVDPFTLETGTPGVFAIGDVTQIVLANGLQLPKAGLFAELEGERVAAAIAADVQGEEPPPPFDGAGYCFVELGPDLATLIQGQFYAHPEPRVELRDASRDRAREKRAFETDRLKRWFG